MNKYIIAVADEYAYIESVIARSIHDAEDKFIHKFCEKYDISYASDWDELIDNLYETNVIIGEIIDVETI